MKLKWIALACAAMLGLGGCAVNGAAANRGPLDSIQESTDGQTTQPDDQNRDSGSVMTLLSAEQILRKAEAEGKVTQVEGNVTGDGTREHPIIYGTEAYAPGMDAEKCHAVGHANSIGPASFNCPAGFAIVEDSAFEVELRDPEIGTVYAYCDQDDHNLSDYPDPEEAWDTEVALVEKLSESCTDFQLRWLEYSPMRIGLSYVADQVGGGGATKVVGSVIYAHDDYAAYLTVTIPADRYAEYASVAEEIADTLHVDIFN